MSRSKEMCNARQDDWPYFKRLMELCYAEPGLIDEAIADLKPELFVHLNEEEAKEALRILHGKSQKSISDNQYLRLSGQIISAVRNRMYERTNLKRIANAKFRSWYQRQKKKICFESFLNRKSNGQYFIPFSFELTEGCSMACSFCCLSAEKLSGCFPYNQKNSALWKDILIKNKEIFGDFADNSVCYFATEPLDNPDYDHFLHDFYEVYGTYPQTTTAKAAQSSERAKKLVKLLGKSYLQEAALRFSVFSKEQLMKIYQLYTPEELSSIELVINNPESAFMYTPAGRARELMVQVGHKKLAEAATSACTIGFVVNLIKGSVMLMAPRCADENYPKGIKVFDTAYFTNIESYEIVINQLINKWMCEEIPRNEVLGFGDRINYQIDGDYLQINGDKIHKRMKMSNSCRRFLLLMIEEKCSMDQAFQILMPSEFQKQDIITKMQLLFDAGYLETV